MMDHETLVSLVGQEVRDDGQGLGSEWLSLGVHVLFRVSYLNVRAHRVVAARH